MFRTLPWRLRTKTLAAGRIPRLMGVVNVTPDSFSDGGTVLRARGSRRARPSLGGRGRRHAGYRRPEHAARGRADRGRGGTPPRVAGGCRLVQANGRADFDRHFQRRGGRGMPFRRGGGHQRHHRTDRGRPDRGPGGRPAVAASAQCTYKARRRRCRSIRATATWSNEVFAWLAARRDALLAAGIARDCIALDPGIGFGKTAAHNLAILKHLSRYRALGCPLLVGVVAEGIHRPRDRRPGGRSHGRHDRRRVGRRAAGG